MTQCALQICRSSLACDTHLVAFLLLCNVFSDPNQLLIYTVWCDAADGDVRGSARRTHQQQSLFSWRLRCKTFQQEDPADGSAASCAHLKHLAQTQLSLHDLLQEEMSRGTKQAHHMFSAI